VTPCQEAQCPSRFPVMPGSASIRDSAGGGRGHRLDNLKGGPAGAPAAASAAASAASTRVD
jgi:hypothetical protein